MKPHPSMTISELLVIELKEQLATIEHVTHDKITENIKLRDTIDTLEAENTRLQDNMLTVSIALDKIAKYTEVQFYCPNSPLAPGEACFCGLPVKPSSLDGKDEFERIISQAHYNGMTMRPDFEKYANEIALRKWDEYERYVLDCQGEGLKPKLFPDWLRSEQ